jgi:pimeloyl-ACP methyl ester carboxylesterase
MPRSTPEEVESLVEMQALSASAEVAAELRRIIGDIDVTPCLEKVTCPTLVVSFTGDQVQSPEQSRQIARALPDAEFHLLDSPNHVLVPSDPVWGTCLDMVEHFLAAGREDADAEAAVS